MKKHLLTLVLAVVTVALFALCTYEYQHRAQPSNAATTNAVNTQKSKDSQTLNLHDSVARAVQASDQKALDLLNSQKSSLCQFLESHKLANPLCQ